MPLCAVSLFPRTKNHTLRRFLTLGIAGVYPRKEDSSGKTARDTSSGRLKVAIPSKSDKSDEMSRKDGISDFRTLSGGFVTFLGVLRGVPTGFTHLFQDIPDRGPSLCALNQAFFPLSVLPGFHPILSRLEPPFHEPPEPGPRAASRAQLLHFYSLSREYPGRNSSFWTTSGRVLKRNLGIPGVGHTSKSGSRRVGFLTKGGSRRVGFLTKSGYGDKPGLRAGMEASLV